MHYRRAFGRRAQLTGRALGLTVSPALCPPASRARKQRHASPRIAGAGGESALLGYGGIEIEPDRAVMLLTCHRMRGPGSLPLLACDPCSCCSPSASAPPTSGWGPRICPVAITRPRRRSVACRRPGYCSRSAPAALSARPWQGAVHRAHRDPRGAGGLLRHDVEPGRRRPYDPGDDGTPGDQDTGAERHRRSCHRTRPTAGSGSAGGHAGPCSAALLAASLLPLEPIALVLAGRASGPPPAYAAEVIAGVLLAGYFIAAASRSSRVDAEGRRVAEPGS